jgi:hypothetical protein
LDGVRRALAIPAAMAGAGFGFESLNRGAAGVTQRAAAALRLTQTGHLSWNIVGVVLALLAVLVFLAT